MLEANQEAGSAGNKSEWVAIILHIIKCWLSVSFKMNESASPFRVKTSVLVWFDLTF